jgi:hypothetical protein
MTKNEKNGKKVLYGGPGEYVAPLVLITRLIQYE